MFFSPLASSGGVAEGVEIGRSGGVPEVRKGGLVLVMGFLDGSLKEVERGSGGVPELLLGVVLLPRDSIAYN